MMDFDWTISIGNILTAMSAMIGVAIVFLRLHRALEDRIMSTHRELERQIFLVDTKIDRKIGGRNEDPPLTQQVAILTASSELRFAETQRLMMDLAKKQNELYRWWTEEMERRTDRDKK